MSRRTVLLGAGAALLVLVLWYFLLWSPQRSKVADARDRRENAEAEAANLRIQLSRLQDLKQREALQRAELETLRVAVPDQPNLAQFILDANDAATKAGIEFLSITPSVPAAATTGNGAPAAGAPPPSVSMTMSIKGGYFQVLDFVNRLTDLPRIVVIDSLNVNAGGGTLDVSLQARMFVSALPAAATPGASTTTTARPAATATTTTTTGAP